MSEAPSPDPTPGPPAGQPDRRQGARREADRLGLTVDGRRRSDRPPGEPNRNPTEREEARRLVLYLAAAPERLAWLRGHVARHMARVAEELDQQGHPKAAGIVNRAAWAHRMGDTE